MYNYNVLEECMNKANNHMFFEIPGSVFFERFQENSISVIFEKKVIYFDEGNKCQTYYT